MGPTFFALVAVVLVLLGSVVAGEAQLVLYDNFTAAKIDPGRWWGSESGVSNTEAIRKISAGQLQLLLTSFGRSASDVGRTDGGSLAL